MKRRILKIETQNRTQVLDVTSTIQGLVQEAFGDGSGLLHVFCPHTTAGVTINESDDPDVKRDFVLSLDEIISFQDKFKHAEGNAKAHVSSVLTGISAHLAVEKGKILLGHWQSIWFCEFDGPRKRELWISGFVTHQKEA